MVELAGIVLVAAVLGWSGFLVLRAMRELGQSNHRLAELTVRDREAAAQERAALLDVLEQSRQATLEESRAATSELLDRLGYGGEGDGPADTVPHLSEDDEVTTWRAERMQRFDEELEKVADYVRRSGV